MKNRFYLLLVLISFSYHYGWHADDPNKKKQKLSQCLQELKLKNVPYIRSVYNSKSSCIILIKSFAGNQLHADVNESKTLAQLIATKY